MEGRPNVGTSSTSQTSGRGKQLEGVEMIALVSLDNKHTPLLKPLFSDCFLKNPHFIFDLEDPDPRDREPECSAIVSLAQKPKDRKEARPIGFRVYRVSLNLNL